MCRNCAGIDLLEHVADTGTLPGWIAIMQIVNWSNKQWQHHLSQSSHEIVLKCFAFMTLKGFPLGMVLLIYQKSESINDSFKIYMYFY